MKWEEKSFKITRSPIRKQSWGFLHWTAINHTFYHTKWHCCAFWLCNAVVVGWWFCLLKRLFTYFYCFGAICPWYLAHILAFTGMENCEENNDCNRCINRKIFSKGVRICSLCVNKIAGICAQAHVITKTTTLRCSFRNTPKRLGKLNWKLEIGRRL